MKVRLEKTFRFEASHWLPQVAEHHKCRRMHGHGYTVCIAVEGEVDPEAGWLIDYQDMVTAWMPLHNQLDHQCLNDVDGLSNSTSEALAFWIWQRLKPQLPQLCEVAVSETSSSCCRYCGE